MKRIAMTLLAAALPLAPRFAQAQVVRIEVPTPLMPMPGGHLPKSPVPTPVPLPNMPTRPFPIPTLPGPLPTHFEFLPNFGTVIPGVHLPEAGVPVRVERLAAAKPAVRVSPVASAESFEKTLSVLRETFGLGDEGGLKTGAKAEDTAKGFDGSGKPGRVVLPEQELERDLGVK